MTTGQERTKQLRGSKDAGREKLLDAARAIFRSKLKREVSRQNIARHAGATPALMTYYFSSNAELVLAATRPVIAEAIAKLLSVIGASTSPAIRFQDIIGLFIDFARDNGALLDVFIEAMVESGDESGQALIGQCLTRLEEFFLEAVESGLIDKNSNPRFLLLASWGMCKLVAESPSLPFPIFDTVSEPAHRKRIESKLIMNLMLHGAGAQLVQQGM